jgi:radical SAM superfamily enzyme YgiQ (UPF0313 family)
MKVLLLLPPYPKDKIFRKSMKRVGAVLPPLGLAYLASMIEKEGNEVKIIDGPALATMEGYGFEELAKDIRSFKPDVAGISASYSQLEYTKKSLSLIKAIVPECVTILGGPLITSVPSMLNEFANLDYGVYGEADFTFTEILKKIANHEALENTDGLIWRENGNVRFLKPKLITNIDEIPMPARHLLKMEIYRPSPANYRRLPATTIMTSRGCPYQCIFCSKPVEGNTFRAHSAKRVVDEIEHLIKEYGIKDIQIFDDTFTLIRQRTVDICNGIIERGLDIGWNCMTRADRVDLELLKLMKKAGCYEVGFGIESGSERVLKLIGKGLTKEQIRESVKNAKKAGLDVRGFFMIGFPTETKEEVLQTIEFAKELDVDVAQFMVATPLPGTKMWDMAKEHGAINESEFSSFTFYAPDKMPFSSELLSEEEIAELYRKANKSFYLRPKFILRQLLKIRTFNDIRRNYEAARSILGL